MSKISSTGFDLKTWNANSGEIERELSDTIKWIGEIVARVDQATLDVSTYTSQSSNSATGYLSTGAYFEAYGRNFFGAPNLLSARISLNGDTIYIEGNFPYKADRGTVTKIEVSDDTLALSIRGDFQYTFGAAFAPTISGTLQELNLRSSYLDLILRGNLEIKSDRIVGGSLSYLDVDYQSVDFSASGAIPFTSSLQASVSSALQRTNTFQAGNGDEVFQGSDDRIDIVKQSAKMYGSQIQKMGHTIVVIDNLGSGGSDTLVKIDRIVFSDTALAFDLTGNAGQAYRVYKAAFARDPMSGDKAGLGYWIAQIDRGMDMVEVAARFIDSPEFRGLYGQNPSNADFLTKVYTNVLGRTPDQGGYNWWLNELNTNPTKTKAKVLADFAESQENKDSVATLIGNGIQYTEFVG